MFVNGSTAIDFASGHFEAVSTAVGRIRYQLAASMATTVAAPPEIQVIRRTGKRGRGAGSDSGFDTVFADSGAPSGSTSQLSTGSAMFLKTSGPRNRARSGSFPLTVS